MDYSYGQELRSARERSGLSLQAVADALHLDPRLIEAIEGEDDDLLPAPAYVRGYIRAYAQLVRCEPDTLIARYNIQAKSDPDLIASVHSVAAFKQERDARLMWVGTGIVVSLLMVVIGGWLLFQSLFIGPPDRAVVPSLPPIAADSPRSPQTVTQPSQQPAAPVSPEPDAGTPASTAAGKALEPAANDSPEAAPPTQTPTVAEASATPVPAEPAQEAAATSSPLSEPAPEQPVIADASTGSDMLRLSLDGISWIEVLDANGERLVYGLFDARTEPLSVRGQAPFDVTIGDANHVDISVNGQFVSFEPYMRRNNTARFKIESSAQ